ncbi:MAG: hypothetical protein ACP5JP_03455 [bacterium]
MHRTATEGLFSRPIAMAHTNSFSTKCHGLLLDFDNFLRIV